MFEQDPSCVAAASRHLLEQPKERLLLRNRQYKICWLQSVDIAMARQRQETEILRRQASQFFGRRRPRGQTPPGEATSPQIEASQDNRDTSLRMDITTPQKYNLRRQRRQMELSDSEDTDIPPAMFEEASESSYSGSNQKDVALRGYDPIESGELEWLGMYYPSASEEASIGNGSTPAASTESSYSGSNQEDIALRGLASIATGELEELEDNSISPAGSYVEGGGPGEEFLQEQERAVSQSLVKHSGVQRTPEALSGALSVAGLPSDTTSALSSIRNRSLCMSHSENTDATFDWQQLSFPLRAIGAIEAPRDSNMEAVSPISFLEERGYPISPAGLVVYDEKRGSSWSQSYIPMGQPSGSMASHPSAGTCSNFSLDFSGHTVEPLHIHRLINRAIHWLLHYTLDNRFEPLDPSIYWAIRSLPVYYEDIIIEAHQQGAPPMIDLHEEEWPDPPEGEDNYDSTQYPYWLIFILNLDKVHEWGLHNITSRRALRQKRKIIWMMPDRLYLKEIPVRELDDPPDSSGLGSSGGENLIEEILSNIAIEDNNWRRT
mmetsp:Transcript_16552/g.23601  ORF Transcript_16552/g.23601 Transcript_16552/m.23601 type:complete len:549 (+) Transcript_16552:2780-4426(+)